MLLDVIRPNRPVKPEREIRVSATKRKDAPSAAPCQRSHPESVKFNLLEKQLTRQDHQR